MSHAQHDQLRCIEFPIAFEAALGETRETVENGDRSGSSVPLYVLEQYRGSGAVWEAFAGRAVDATGPPVKVILKLMRTTDFWPGNVNNTLSATSAMRQVDTEIAVMSRIAKSLEDVVFPALLAVYRSRHGIDEDEVVLSIMQDAGCEIREVEKRNPQIRYVSCAKRPNPHRDLAG